MRTRRSTAVRAPSSKEGFPHLLHTSNHSNLLQYNLQDPVQKAEKQIIHYNLPSNSFR